MEEKSPKAEKDQPDRCDGELDVVQLPHSEGDSGGDTAHLPVRKTSGPIDGKPKRLTLAIDFGSNTLKAVVLKSGKATEIVWWGIYEAESETGSLSEAEVVAALRGWMEEIGGVDQIVLGTSQDQVYVRFFQLPVENENEFRQAVELEIQSGPDFKTLTDRVEVIPIARINNEDMNGWMGLVYIVREENLLNLYERLNSFLNARMFIRPSVLGPATIYLPLAAGKTVALVDLGAKYTRISILSHGKLALVREVPTGSESLTRELMNSESDRAHAEFRKRKAILTSVADELDQHSLAINGREVSVWSIQQWITDIRNTLTYFELHHQKSVEDILLLGGGARLSALTEILELELGMRIQCAKLPDRIIMACKNDLDWFMERYPRFAVAIGLALPPQPTAGICNLPVARKGFNLPLSMSKSLMVLIAGTVLLAAVIWPRILLHQSGRELQERHRYVQELSARLEMFAPNSDEFWSDDADLEAQMTIDIIRMLDWFADNLPADAWLNSIQISNVAEDKVRVKGQALSIEDVRILLQRMLADEDRPGRLLEFEAELEKRGYRFSAKLQSE
ncbi:MAG: pilus assembly protein PilM [candidate division KSB1 bacterium]|nr:pilus assembly protein PilM [candidate division KSB1 bacterium]MDQ7062858.1 pilus assembly protein PilM [candidate division KSB1 bacterium]